MLRITLTASIELSNLRNLYITAALPFSAAVNYVASGCACWIAIYCASY